MLRKIISILLLVSMLLSAACAQETIIPFGEELSFQTQVNTDGKARLAAGKPFETLSFTIRVVGNRGPVHFKKFYEDSFALRGNEAVVEFELTLNSDPGDMQINPGNVILFTLMAENGAASRGYQLMNWEIGGSADIPMQKDVPVTIFKRYDFDEDDENPMKYLLVHSFNGGVEEIYTMEISDPKGENTFFIVYDELKRKSRGKAVTALQSRLKELGLLSGSSVDGVYGPGTAESVKAAQKLLGFEETGVADHAFQKALFKYQPDAQ